MSVDQYYNMELERASDINEHLPVLLELANDCDTIVELGTRWVVSTWAFLKSSATRITMCDLKEPDVWHDSPENPSPTPCKLEEVIQSAPDKDVNFIKGSSLDLEITDTDLLFIDTWHCYDQLKAELDKHAHAVNKYIVLHDVVLFKYVGENFYGDQTRQYEGLQKAVDEFLEENKNWSVHQWHTNNNGLGVLKRND
jgi:cephalosporin hydroxylase|tara:strand:+ start:5659 stop:6249 length:591 start_codon:yes stop_codon:yes gene_type:complete